MKLFTKTYNGNIHEATHAINKEGLAHCLLALHPLGENYCNGVFRVSVEECNRLRIENGWHGPTGPEFDDPPMVSVTMRLGEVDLKDLMRKAEASGLFDGLPGFKKRKEAK